MSITHADFQRSTIHSLSKGFLRSIQVERNRIGGIVSEASSIPAASPVNGSSSPALSPIEEPSTATISSVTVTVGSPLFRPLPTPAMPS